MLYCLRVESWIPDVMETFLYSLLSLTTLVQLSKAFQLFAQNEYNVSACFDQSERVLRAECAEGFQVKVDRVLYGHSSTGTCHMTDGDCLQEDKEFISCVGHRTCEINLPTGDRGRQLPQCGLHSTYMQLQYSCIEDTDSTNICARDKATEQNGYIRTPRYPNNYPSSEKCQLAIEVDRSQKLTLYAIDFDLESDPNGGCVDSLHIQSDTRDYTTCSKRQNEEIFKTVGNTITLTFESKGQGQSKGFWLYYEASPLLPETTTSTTALPSTVTTTPVPSSVSTPHHKPSSVLPPGDTEGKHPHFHPTPKKSDSSSDSLPTEAIIGGVLGTLLFILFILLILLIIKRRKERDMNSSPSTSYLNSRNTSGSPVQGNVGPYIQNNLYAADDKKLFTKV